MNDLSDEDIIGTIERIQRDLEKLKIAIETKSKVKKERTREIKVGDLVSITNNLRSGQEREGEVTKYNKETGFITIRGRKRGNLTVRKISNVRKIDEYTKE